MRKSWVAHAPSSLAQHATVANHPWTTWTSSPKGAVGVWRANTLELANRNSGVIQKEKNHPRRQQLPGSNCCGTLRRGLGAALCAFHSSLHLLPPSQVNFGQPPTARPTPRHHLRVTGSRLGPRHAPLQISASRLPVSRTGHAVKEAAYARLRPP